MPKTGGIAGGQESAESQSHNETLDSVMRQLLEFQGRTWEIQEGMFDTFLGLKGCMEESVCLMSEVIVPTLQHKQFNIARVAAAMETLVQEVYPALL